jgi:peptidoglycan DL-endopeptidase CwlO
VTDVEFSSTALSYAGRNRAKWYPMWYPMALTGAVLTLSSLVLLAAPRVAAGDPLSDAQAQAAQISAQLQNDAARADQLSQQYENAQANVQQLDSQIQQIHANVVADQGRVHTDQLNLRHQAIEAYVSSGDENALTSLFAAGGEKSEVEQQYSAVASGNVSNAIDNLDVAERALATQQEQLQGAQSQAQAALDSAGSAKQAADAIVASQEATLSQVKGQIATLVAQQQAAQAAAQHAAFVAQQNAQAAAQAQAQAQANSQASSQTNSQASSQGGGTSASTVLPNLPASGGAAAAVAAAESQLGVPYVWGGETPGVGFDCSGLTQWAWGEAGVSIPRTAQDQFDAIPQVSLSDLEPGDLLFWGYGTGDIYHVAMYVGGGEVIQAPETGEDVSISPIWDDQLVGAGRP